MTDNGNVRAVVLGVGGFLGMGEKNMAVSMSAIDMTKDGSSSKLVVKATKDQIKSAPTYDTTAPNYMK